MGAFQEDGRGVSRMRDIALSRGLGIPCGLGKPVRLRLEDENLPIRFCGLVILQGGQPELRLPGERALRKSSAAVSISLRARMPR